jgi:hypothetical protein
VGQSDNKPKISAVPDPTQPLVVKSGADAAPTGALKKHNAAATPAQGT